MKIALVGATGPVGKRLLAEALSRGHTVTAVVRDVTRVPKDPRVTAVASDVNDPDALADVLAGHETVILSVRYLKMDAKRVIEAVRRSGVPRLLVVGGAASLYLPGTQTKIIDSGQIPEQYRSEPLAGVAFLSQLKATEGLAWTFLSPAMMFSNDENFGTAPGGRTGVFRTGLDELLVSDNGESTISYEDYAVAMIDELENPRHTGRRFTVGY